MSETAGSCGIFNQSTVARRFTSFNSAKQTIRNEIRKNELAQKSRESGLSTPEKAEMLAYKANDVIDWLGNAGKGSICYYA